MGFSAKVGSFNTGTGTTSIDVTCGFQPKAIIFFWSGRTETSNTQGEATAIYGMGFGVSATDRRAVCNRSAHGSGNAAADMTHSNAACVLSQSATAIDGALDLAGWRWLFLLEGLPVIAVGLVALLVFPAVQGGDKPCQWSAGDVLSAAE